MLVPSVDPAYVNLKSAAGRFYVMENGHLELAPAPFGFLGVWAMEPIERTPYVRLRNRATGDYHHTEQGPIAIWRLETGTIQSGWWSAMCEAQR